MTAVTGRDLEAYLSGDIIRSATTKGMNWDTKATGPDDKAFSGAGKALRRGNVGGAGEGGVVRIPGSRRLAGVVTTAELTAAGASPGQIRHSVRQGALLRLTRGGYASAELVAAESTGRAGEHAIRVAGALAVAGSDAVASHHSAAIIHGLDLLGYRPDGTVAMTRPPGGTRKGRSGVHLHLAALPAGHVVTRRGLPVTSVGRTVVDLARASSFRAGVVAADSALRSGQVSKADLDLCITACAGWPGIQDARRAAAFADGRAESVLESISRVVFDELGLPPPDLQAWVGDENEIIGRVDFLWRATGRWGRPTAR